MSARSSKSSLNDHVTSSAFSQIPVSFDPLWDLSGDLIMVADEEGQLVQVNTAFQSILGYSPAESAQMTFSSLLHPQDRDHALHMLKEALRTGQSAPVYVQAYALSKYGDSILMEWRLKVQQGYLYCMARDIRTLQKQQEALIRHEEQLSEAESIGKIGRWRWTLGQAQFEWSEELYRIFDLTPDHFDPTLQAVNSRLHREDQDRMSQAFQRALISQTPYDIDFRVIKQDGDIAYIRCQGRCAVNEAGEVIALYGIMQDVTERALHEIALKQAKEAAERAYASKTQFLANMSHELRTPLNAIIGFSEMIQRQLLGPIGTDKYLDYIGGIRESGEHLLDLISDILDMSKIEAGKYTLDLEELNIAKLIRMSIHMIKGRALEDDIKLVPEFQNEKLIVVADRRAMLQMLLNLLSNAVKFSNKKGTVYISCLEREQYYSIKISDEGVGIPAHKLKDVLNPFEQAPSNEKSHYSRDHEGTGLGLAITKDLAELHGGGLYIESKIGRGTTVTIRMPYDTRNTRKDLPA